MVCQQLLSNFYNLFPLFSKLELGVIVLESGCVVPAQEYPCSWEVCYITLFLHVSVSMVITVFSFYIINASMQVPVS